MKQCICPPPVACICLSHTGHRRCLWQLPGGSFFIPALILSWKSSSVLSNFPDTVSAQPRVIVSGTLQNSHLRADELLQCEGLDFSLKINKNYGDLSLLCCAPASCSSLLMSLVEFADSPGPLFTVRGSDHGHLRVQTCYNHCFD